MSMVATYNHVCAKAYCSVQQHLKSAVDAFGKSEKGVTAIEYAVVVAGVAGVVMVVFGTDGPVKAMITTTFTTLQTKVGSMLTPTP